MGERRTDGGWREVGERVFVKRYAFFDQNIGAVVGDDGILLIDTRTTPRQADEIRRDLASLTPLPVTAVVNTHMHFDHTFGNMRFAGTPIWGHDRCAEALRRLTDEDALGPVLDRLIERMPDLEEDLLEVEIVPPDRTFADATTIEWSGRTLSLRHLGRGHTDNDVVIVVPPPAAGSSSGAGGSGSVLFAGDLLEAGAPPSFGDAYPLDWPATLDAVLTLPGDAIVPGHGPVGDRSFALAQREDLAAVAELAREVHRDEIALEEALAAGPFPPDAMGEALERALAQLRGELV